MKRFLSLLTVLAFVGITNVWGGEYTKKTYDTNSSTFKTGYKRQAGDNFVWWGQKGYYGANSADNHGKLKPTDADLPVVKAQLSTATTSTTGYYYLYTSEAVANVNQIEIYLSAKSGSGTVNAYIVSSSTAASSGSATWSKVTLSSSSAKSQGANVASANTTYTFTFNATETNAKYYGVVFVTSSYWRATNLTMKLNTPTYTVSYANGGGSGTNPGSHTNVQHGTNVTLKSNTFTAPAGKQFNGWSDGTTTRNAGVSYTVTADKTMTAQWTCITPTISSQTVSSATYTAGDTPSNLSVTASGGSLSYQWKQSATENGTYVNVTSGTGGTTATYTPSTSAASDLWYQCTVTNTGSSCGTTALSNKAHIVVNEAVACTATPSIGAVSLNGPFFVTHLKIFHHIIMSMFASLIL